MRKGMKHRVALFLSAAMMLTSVDGSTIVMAADAAEEVLEISQEEVSGEENPVQLSEPVNEQEENEELLAEEPYIEEDGEQFVGSETQELQENIGDIATFAEETPDYSVKIINDSGEVTAEVGEDVTLSVEATTEYGELSYRWYIWDDSSMTGDYQQWIDGATSSSLTVKNVQRTLQYYCVVSNGYETEETKCWIYVNSGFEVTPEDLVEIDVKKGDTATLKVNARSNYPLTYEWYRRDGEFDEDRCTKLDNITDTYTTPRMTERKVYFCRVSDGHNIIACWFAVNVEEINCENHSWDTGKVILRPTC